MKYTLISLVFVAFFFIHPFPEHSFAQQTITSTDNIRPDKPYPVLKRKDTDGISYREHVPHKISRYHIDKVRTRVQQMRIKNGKNGSPSRLDLGIMNSTINVPGDFKTIQAAIDAALDGDTILVASGAYKETLEIIDKDLTLQGEDKDSTIIDGRNFREWPTVFVTGGDINISGFTIKNGMVGLFISNSTGLIAQNTINNNNDNGLEVIDSADINIINNLIEDNEKDGVWLDNFAGSIVQNTISGNKSDGMDIFNSSNIEIKDNVIKNNGSNTLFSGRGISIENCSIIDISGNSIEDNVESGFDIFLTDTVRISDNEIIDNDTGIIIFEASLIKVLDNNIARNSFSGIDICFSSDIEITDNQIIDTISLNLFNSATGIGVQEFSLVSVVGNEIKGTEGDGMFISFSNVELVENLITDNDSSGIFCDTASDSIINGCCNVVTDNKTDLDDCPSTVLECPCPDGNSTEDIISIKPSSVLLTGIGLSVQLTAILESENGATLNITKGADWSSSDRSVTTIDTNGILTATGDGQSTTCADFNVAQGCMEANVNTVHSGINQWTTTPDSETLAFVNDIIIDSVEPNIIYAGLDTGKIFKSMDGGETWKEKSLGLSNANVMALVIDPENSNTIYAAASGSVFKSTDAGDTWNEILEDLFATTIVINPVNTDIIYVGTLEDGIFKSVNGGETFKKINRGLRFKTIREDSLVINPVNPEILYVALEDDESVGRGVFKTTNGGRSWREVNNGLGNRFEKEIFGLDIDSNNPDILYAGSMEGVFRTTNSGDRWTLLENSPREQTKIITVDNLNTDVVYVGSANKGIFTSRDAGQSWTALNTQLTNRTIRALKIDPVNATTIYAGTRIGVFRFTHSFSSINATPNQNGTSIDIEYIFNKDSGIKPLGFNIYRSTSVDGDFEKITENLLDPESTRFNDRDFLAGVTHVYKMTVVSKEGETLKSFAVSAKPLLESNPDFNIEAIESEKEVVQGASVSIPLTITGRDNFADEVFLTATGFPEDVTIEFLPESGVPTIAVTLNVKTGTSTPTGDFEITITATAGEKTVTKTVKLSVTETGSNDSSITQMVNAIDIRVGDKVEITGEIIPLQIGASITATFESPDEEVSSETAITDANGKYSVIKELDKSGTWKVTTSWKGNEELSGSSSREEEIFASQAVTTISMVTDATSETESGDTLILTGNISPNPGAGKLFLEINNMDGSINFNSLISISSEGEFSNEFKVAGGEEGTVEIFARFDGTDDYGGSEKRISVPIQEPVGMAIIVAGGGDGEDNVLREAANSLCNYVYTIVKNQGIPDTAGNNRIFYLHPDPDNDADGDGISDTDAAPTIANLQNAIEEWALGLADVRVGDTIKTTPLTIYMMGPGEIDSFEITKDESVTAVDLKSWLNNLFTDVRDKFQTDEFKLDSFPVNVIIESPQSGSFIDDLKVEDGIGRGRVVVTSTDYCKEDTETCNAGEINITGDGSISFTKQFFFGIKIGKSITTAWAESNLTIQGLFDDQFPQLDADGNGEANKVEDEIAGGLVFINQNRVPENRDSKSNSRVFQESSEQATFDAQSFITNRKPVISGSQKDIVVRDSTATLWAIVEDPDDGIKDVQALLFLPKSNEPEILNLQFSEENNRYETTFNDFSMFGLYKALFVASDKSNNTSLPARTSINSQTIIPALLKGKVTDITTKKPLERIKVWRQGVRGSVNTDKNGNYLMQVDQGVYTFFAEKEGFKLKTVKDFSVNSTSRTLNIELEPTESDTTVKSFTFNCEHGFKRGGFFGLEKLTLELGDTENCTLKLTDHEPGKTVEISTL
ncbi:MAG: right-handed parallel beta-helix repeat-containing protein, partial [Candidatus Anammoxibacter sp.]